MPVQHNRLDRSRPLILQAANLIEANILSGAIRPGEEVPQLKLSRQLGLSQPSIREALKELEHRGLVMKKGRVRTISDFSEHDLGNMFQVRMLLEPFACRLVAYTWTEQFDDQMKRYLALMKKALVDRNTRDYVCADLEFHRAMWHHQPNPKLDQLLNILCTPLFAYELILYTVSNRLDLEYLGWNIGQTQLILSALRTRNGDTAERVVRHVLARFQRRVLSGRRCLRQQAASHTRTDLADSSETISHFGSTVGDG